MHRALRIFGFLAFPVGLCFAAGGRGADPDFKPELAGVEFTSHEVRPGEPFALTLKFRNAGRKPAAADYRVFVHFEARQDCREMAMGADHLPTEPTTLWQPGQTIVDGPRLLVAPADPPEQEYHVHVGLFDADGNGERLLDSYAAEKLRVTRRARPVAELSPPKLSGDVVERRRAALAARIAADSAATLETAAWRLGVDRASGAWALTDKATGVLWTSDPVRPRFGEIILRRGGHSAVWRIDRFDEIRVSPRRLRLLTRPLVDGQPSGVSVVFAVEPVSEPDGLRWAYKSQAAGAWQVSAVRLLANAFSVTEEDDGRIYVPHRLGIERAARQAFPGSDQWRTYDDLSMAMCGAVKQGSALLVSWDNVDTTLSLHADWPDLPLVPGRRACGLGLEIAAPEGACTIHPLGEGNYVEIARAYRPLAKAKGWLQTWAEKRKRYPTVDRMFGAMDFKPFVFSRLVPSSTFNRDKKEHVSLGFTFDEAAQCAEHWRNDLGIEKAFVVLAGWIHRGYDVGHPDVLPAAPECGGNQGLARAAQRIKACGYLFGLHDNYQDMYEDTPSWSQSWLNKDARGKARMGGNWNGGQAWQVCAIKQVELAGRPQTNLPRISELFDPTIYFIDTVFAWGLVTCEDPAHPMTRRDDLEWKSRLCLLAKRHFGLFGSEEGREWAVPCADYLEGIFSHQCGSPPGSVIPLFPLVYSDCVQLMTHQSDRVGPGDEKKIADHVLFAEMPLPQFGNHLYWKEAGGEGVGLTPLAPRVKDLGGRRFAVTYRWKLERPIPWDGSFFVHFTRQGAKRAEGIAFQNDHLPRVPLSRWRPGIVQDGPHVVEIPGEVGGRVEIAVGLLHDGQRVALRGPHEGLRYVVGTLAVEDQKIEFQPAPPRQSTELWSRGDGGWGERLSAEDRVIKNTWEVLSPLNVITAERLLTRHEFLTPDRLVQRTRFGDLSIIVTYGRPARIGQNRLPAYGFLVESPGYVAFCATRYNGVEYDEPALFTARSLDGKPLAESARVRIYHGFGDRQIRLSGKEFRVAREAIVSMN
jgi:hypothetical protein